MTAGDDSLFPVRADRPYVFDREMAWLPFIPIYTPFLEPLQTLGGPVAVKQSQSERQHPPIYEFSPLTRKKEWLEIEERLMDLIHYLASYERTTDQKKQITLPLRPSAFGFATTARCRSDMHADINKSRRRFVHLLACVSYLLDTDILSVACDGESTQPPTPFSQDWRKAMLPDDIFPRDWAGALSGLQDLYNSRSLRRVGVFLQLENTLQYGANISFYVNCGIPVWYFWDAVAVKTVQKNRGLLAYAPLPQDVWRILGEPRLFSRPVEKMRLQMTRLQSRIHAHGPNTDWFHRYIMDEETVVTLFSPVIAYPATHGPHGSDYVPRTGMLVRLAFPSWTYSDPAVRNDAPQSSNTSTPNTNFTDTPALHPISPPPSGPEPLKEKPRSEQHDVEDALYHFLRLRYGFVDATYSTPMISSHITDETWCSVLRDVGLGFYASLPVDNKHKIAWFITTLSQSTTPSTDLSDVNPNPQYDSLREYMRTRLTIVPPNHYKIQPDLTKDSLVVLHTSTHAMYACRLQLISGLSLTRALLEVGIPFEICSHKNTKTGQANFPLPRNAYSVAYRRDHTFTPDDYEIYLARRAQFATRAETRKALFQGGITWRLMVASIPDIDVVVRDVFSERQKDDHVAPCDDDQETQLADLYGFLSIATDNVTGAQSAETVSWWPTGRMWRRGRRDLGFWTADDEQWYRDRIIEISTGAGQPLSATKWRARLKRGPKNGSLVRQQNERVQKDLVQSVLYSQVP